MLEIDPRVSTILSSSLMFRGNIMISDINRNIEKYFIIYIYIYRLKNELKMIYWNSEGFKTGHCNEPPIGSVYNIVYLLFRNNLY